MRNVLIYIHGQGGSIDEAMHYAPLFPGYEVIGFDYHAQTPWEAVDEFRQFFDALRPDCGRMVIVANSLGAYFTLISLADRTVDMVYLISPIANMERLITDMISWAGVTEQELREKGIIETGFGDPLSWTYLTWVREHPIRWELPTCVLYGDRDHLQSLETLRDFSARTGAKLTVMPDAEHWIHTDEQMRFLDAWIRENPV